MTMRAMMYPVLQPLGAILPSLSTNTISVRPAVTRKAPSQSTLLSASVDAVSFSIHRSPAKKHAPLTPVIR